MTHFVEDIAPTHLIATRETLAKVTVYFAAAGRYARTTSKLPCAYESAERER